MKQIKYMHNWNNKLSCEYHTTIRKHSQSKYEYYVDSIGDKFTVLLKNVNVNTVTLVSVETFNFHKVHPLILTMDTGMEKEKYIQLFSRFGIKNDDLVIVLLFKKWVELEKRVL